MICHFCLRSILGDKRIVNCSFCAKENGLVNVQITKSHDDFEWIQFEVESGKEIGIFRDYEIHYCYINITGKNDVCHFEVFDLNPSNARQHFERILKIQSFS